MPSANGQGLISTLTKLLIERPAGGSLVQSQMHMAEIRGTAESIGGQANHFDVMIAIDVSQSTKAASGADVDGDGEFGENPHEALYLPGHPGLNHPPLVVPEGRYYLLGDNRDNSNDSRRWGTVRREELKGPVIFNYWSWNNQESWAAMLNPLTWIRLLWGEMRWGRIGMTYDCRAD